MYLIFPKIKVMIIFKHLFVISIPSKTLATSSQYVRKLAIFALLIEGRGITMLVATLAALAAGLVVGAADVKHETRGGVQAAVHKKKKTAHHSCDFFTGL